MKKLISLLLALTMVFSLAICASAETVNGTTSADATIEGHTVVMYKDYKISGDTAANPAEEFTFTSVPGIVVDGGVIDDEGNVIENAPALKSVSVAKYTDGEASTTERKEITITLPAYEAVGVYYYTLTETYPEKPTAGVTYFTDKDDAEGEADDEIITLVVTVVQDGDDNKLVYGAIHCESPVDTGNAKGQKTNVFENSYSAGSLHVEKQVEGNMGDRDMKFAFEVTFTPAEGTEFKSNQLVPSVTTAPTKNDDGSWTYKFELADDEGIDFSNVPVGTTYVVKETQVDGYTADKNNVEGNIEGTEEDTVVITNTKTAEVDTGITLDSMPFVLILAVCAGAAVLFVIKRRSVEF